MQLTKQDNVGTRFWEKYITNVSQVVDLSIADIKKLGFPDTEDKFGMFVCLRNHRLPNRHFLFVIDDVHLITDTGVLFFVEKLIHNIPGNISLILICREMPKIVFTDLAANNSLTYVNEKELKFTENEIAQYLLQQGLQIDPKTIRQICQDTAGWAFSLNLVMNSLQKMPRYVGYVQMAVKQNVFKLMESVAWVEVSERLRNFMLRISLIDHLSANLVYILADGNDSLIDELKKQNAYIRFDSYTNSYLIHHLFLDFLHTKLELLNPDEKLGTYKIAADWCRHNGFIVDALDYYERVGDYGSIVSIFIESLLYIPNDIAQRALGIFERAPSDTFAHIKYFAVMHLDTVISAGLWQEFYRLAEYYEQMFLTLPVDSDFKNHSLGGLYLYWGLIRVLMCTIEDIYDYDVYYGKMADCFIEIPPELINRVQAILIPWLNLTGSARKGSLMEFVEAMARTVNHFARCSDIITGHADLTLGELLFYKDDVNAAEHLFAKVLNYARKNRQFQVVYYALFYIVRIAVSQGNRDKAEQALSEMETQLIEENYPQSFYNYDIAIGWYYYVLHQPERLPDWLKEKFAPYSHAYFAANFGNHMKARYHYLTKNYVPLLEYINGVKQRESILYGRVELLAMEASVYYQKKDKTAAFAALRDAYETAYPNDILMPFIELGSDMRNLALAALRKADINIPREWLETVRRRSATYAKNHSLLLTDYAKASGKNDGTVLSARENDVLIDLYKGFNRQEIAANKHLSLNTINSVISSIFNKLGAQSIVDVIRIATERNLLKKG